MNFAVFAPTGTVAVSSVSEVTVQPAAFPPIATREVCLRLTPVMVTTVPDDPLVGLRPVICGITRNFLLLFNVTLEFVAVTNPVVAPLGTAAVRKVPDLTIGIAGVPLKETVLVKLKP